jgi:MoaA/NifB/PqqE/SkfB family radical SAM enzyme
MDLRQLKPLLHRVLELRREGVHEIVVSLDALEAWLYDPNKRSRPRDLFHLT